MGPLSYSSMKKVATCEQKYWHYKVNKTPPDSDAETTSVNLDIGKAFHLVLEVTEHQFPGDEVLQREVKNACKEFNCIENAVMILAMCIKYYEVHSRTRLSIVSFEFAIETKVLKGFIDGIVTDSRKNWWIMDMKTAKSMSERDQGQKLAQLHRDPQLNIYSSCIDHLAGYLGLDVKKFVGCIYRVITKPQLKKKAREDAREYLARMVENCQVLDFFVPKKHMRIKEAHELFLDYRERADELHNGRVPLKNFSSCFEYHRPCEYFSQCHGREFSDVPSCQLRGPDFFRNYNRATSARNKL